MDQATYHKPSVFARPSDRAARAFAAESGPRTRLEFKAARGENTFTPLTEVLKTTPSRKFALLQRARPILSSYEHRQKVQVRKTCCFVCVITHRRPPHLVGERDVL